MSTSTEEKTATATPRLKQRYRDEIVASLRHAPRLLFLDEPTIGLHPRDNDRLINILEHLRDIGNTVLVVEHEEVVGCLWHIAFPVMGCDERLVVEFYDGFNFGRFIKRHPHLKGPITDLLIGDMFRDELDVIVEPTGQDAYTIFAQSMDRTGEERCAIDELGAALHDLRVERSLGDRIEQHDVLDDALAQQARSVG